MGAMIEIGGMLIGSLLAYAIAVVYAHHYGRDWVTPEGTGQSNWKLRHDIGVALGAISVATCAIVCTLFIPSWLGRIFTLAQAVILASAGASDVRKFHLPLPLTMLGLCLAIITLVLTKTPMMIVLFGLVWAAALIALHAALSKGSMQLGDHLATLWIALAMPFNGMVAVILGDFANVGVARMKSLQGKKVAAAGAWLIFAAALVGLPPYYALYQDHIRSIPAKSAEASVIETADENSIVHADDVGSPTQAIVVPTSHPNAKALLDVMALARYETGRLAMIDQRSERIKQARRASAKVARLAAIAAQRGGSHELVETLSDLSHSLAAYDVEGVQAASADLASTYDALEASFVSHASKNELNELLEQSSTQIEDTETTTE
jgi:hypothetical protein